MKRSIGNTLLILIIFLMMTGGTGAVYVDKKQKDIRVSSASIGLKVSEPVFYNLPEEISNDSEIDFSVKVENTGSVPVYLSENITYEINDRFDSEDIMIEKAEDEQELETISSDAVLGSMETREIFYRISFPGLQEIPEGSISINGSIIYTASTSPDGSSGFVSEPEEVNIGIGNLKLYSDIKEENAMVKDNDTDNNEEIPESAYMATESTLDRISGVFISTASEIEEDGMD